MLLKHNQQICDIEDTNLLDDEVIKDLMAKLSPYVIFVENQELLESFGTTLVNFSPISLNIVDFWNKDIIENTAFIPAKFPETRIHIIQPFEFAEPQSAIYSCYEDMVCDAEYNCVSDPIDPIDPEYGEGFFKYEDEYGRLYGGALLDYKKSFEELTDARVCPSEGEERFFINSMIGVQDKLAYINMHNFYSTLGRSINDVMIYERLKYVMNEYGKDVHFFANTNVMFTEDRFLANRSFVTKKGTDLAIKYAGRTAFESQIQGQDTLYGPYYMDVIVDEPFRYHIDSNLLNIVFEKFVKPLAHPIGMGYSFSTVCNNPIASETEYPLIKYNYTELDVLVKCMCWFQDQDGELLEDVTWIPNDPINPDTKTVCIYNIDPDAYPEYKVFASKDGTGLWEPIADDRNTMFALEEGIEQNPSNPYNGNRYKKYIFFPRNENGSPITSYTNYLIEYFISPTLHNSPEKVIIQYYRFHSFDSVTGLPIHKMIHQFINQRHCTVGFNEEPKRISIIDESVNSRCEDSDNGIFQFMKVIEHQDPNFNPGDPSLPTDPNNPVYDCYNIYKDDPTDPNDDPANPWDIEFLNYKTGGAFERWTDIYFGWFRFKDKDEDPFDVTYDENGLITGFGQSFITQLYLTYEDGDEKWVHDEEIGLKTYPFMAREEFINTEYDRALDYFRKELDVKENYEFVR